MENSSKQDTASVQARSILGPTKETEFLQSFVRVGAGDEEDEIPIPKASISKRVPVSSADKTSEGAASEKDDKGSIKESKDSLKQNQKKKPKRKQKKERRRREEELYTDKDRAAAVVMGYKDIKHSLSMKDKAERSSALQLPAEADAGTLLALARAEISRERHNTALTFVNKVISNNKYYFFTKFIIYHIF